VKKAQTPNDDWQRIWLSASEKDWSSLVLVPNDDTVDAVRFAEMLAKTGRVHGERPVSVVSAVGVQLGEVEATIDSINETTNRGERVIVPVDPIADHPAAIAILRASSAALLLVRLGESELATAHSTIEIVGKERLLGSVVVKSAEPAAAKDE
jgi:hypothetical protein